MTYGQYTQIILEDVSPLLSDPKEGYNRDAGRYALELAAAAYSFNLRPWLEAGWTDMTMQIDRRLLRGIRAAEEDRSFRQGISNMWTEAVTQRLKGSTGMFLSARAMLKQVWESDTGRAVVMLHQAEDKWLVAIGFAGTGKRMVDWIPNFNFAHPDGLHAGFESIMRQFLNNAPNMAFPTAAGALGLESLSLQDILDSMQHEDSPFRMFAAGHSQGGAVAQLWIDYLLRQGVKPDKLCGYGFASPSVCRRGYGEGLLPVILISNSDDIFARVGLSQHLGRQFVYPADQDMREKCYKGLQEDPLFMQQLNSFNLLNTTETALMHATAMVYALSYLDDAEAALVLKDFAQTSLIDLAEGTVQSFIRLMRRFYRQSYEQVTGHPPDRQELLLLARNYLQQMRALGARPLMHATFQAIAAPHHLVFRDETLPGMAPYVYIVVRGYPMLEEVV